MEDEKSKSFLKKKNKRTYGCNLDRMKKRQSLSFLTSNDEWIDMKVLEANRVYMRSLSFYKLLRYGTSVQKD